MKQLFYCTTPFQIMIALYYKVSLFKNEECDIVIADHINNHPLLCDGLKKTKLFSNVYDFKAFEMDKFQSTVSDSFTKKLRLRKEASIEYPFLVDKDKYCAFWVSDSLPSSDIMFSLLKKANKSLKLVFFEEGPVSVISNQQGFILKNNNRNFLKRFVKECFFHYKEVRYHFDFGYFSYSDFFNDKETNFPVYAMPKLNNDEFDVFVKNSNIVWDYNHIDLSKYKCIFFEESFHLVNIKDSAEQIISDLLEKYKPEQILIKLHPRTKNNRFSKYGVDIFEKTNAPWELIALNESMKDIALISIASSSIAHPAYYWNLKSRAVISLLRCKEYHFEGLDNTYYNQYYDYFSTKKVSFPNDKNEFVRCLDGNKQ